MPELHELEEPEDNEEDWDSVEGEQFAINQLAIAYYINIITDDNDSPLNGTTGLDQAIACELSSRISSLEDFSRYKDRILATAEEFADLCKDLKCEGYHGTFIHNDGETPKEREKRFREYEDFIVVELAELLLLKIVTDDNNESINGYTQLEQVVLFYLGYMSECSLKGVKSRIYSRLSDRNSGYHIRGLTYSDLIDLFPEIPS